MIERIDNRPFTIDWKTAIIDDISGTDVNMLNENEGYCCNLHACENKSYDGKN